MRAARWNLGWALFVLILGLAGPAQAETDLRLLGDRFRVSAEWHTADGAHGEATAIPLTGETGLFWFFSSGNVELVVKVLDACAPPYERMWFYAAGLTDVEVELTVEDTWTRQVKTYLRPRGSLFAPLADTSTFNGCDAQPPSPPACGQGTREEIEATPRPDHNLEALALLLGPGITADPDIYDRLVDDMARIRPLSPTLSDAGFLLYWEPTILGVKLDPGAWAAAKAGTYTAWDCLNTWYGMKTIEVSTFIPWAWIQYEGRFQTRRIGDDYEALPGVVLTEASAIGYPAGGPPLPDLCVMIDGVAYDYFLFEGGNQARTWYVRVPYAGAVPVSFGSIGSSDPQPQWWPQYLQCRSGLSKAAFD